MYVVGVTSLVILQAVNHKGNPCKEPVSCKCELVSELTGTRTRGSIERNGQDKYKISYQPTIKGRHRLHIKVNVKHIKGSPFIVTAILPMDKLGTPILALSGVDSPWGVGVSQKQEVVVTEWSKHCISVFTPNGKKLRTFGSHGSATGQLSGPAGVTIDDQGNIIVADSDNHRIQKFTSEGQFLVAVGTKGNG